VSRERDDARTSVKGLCGLVGYSRQAYYKERRRRSREEIDEDAIVELVKKERKIQPKLGTRKLKITLAQELAEMGIRIGRDRLFAVLRKHELLIATRRRAAQTTDSRHGWYAWPNLLRNVVPSVPHQVWVSDLTYIRTDEGFMYLSLVTDAYSRKVVGYCIHDSLETIGCLNALRMALAQLPQGACPFHHSDRGAQYCCADYVDELERRGCPISMTEINHCYENAKAERVNGILKGEYGLNETFRTKSQATEAARQAIAIYNDRRLHTALGYRTPSSVHGQREAA
jgi:putative transposase